ncbi:MAG: glycosyltransferase family 4 protein [Verrucomicrobiota bacterium]
MKIAFAIEHFNPKQGGAERYAWGLAQWLVRHGHAVDVFTRETSEDAPAGIDIRRLAVPAHPRRNRPARFAAALGRALEQRSHDLVQAFNHAWPCDVLRLGGGVHLAFEKYNAWSAPSPAERMFRAMLYRVLPQYRALRRNEEHQFNDPDRHFIAVSQRVANDMARYYPSCCSRIHMIRNGVDVSVYNPARVAPLRAQARAKIGLDESMLAFLFVANNFRLKGLHDLIRALPIVLKQIGRPLRLLVVGRGHTEAFRIMACRLGVDKYVQFCGSAPDLIDYFAAADALLHPSYYDAFGFVCLEAVACGLPVVVSTNSGASEIMHDRPGCVLIDMPCEPAELAGAMLRVAEPAARETTRDAQWALAQEHSMEKNYEAVRVLYEQVSKEKVLRKGL